MKASEWHLALYLCFSAMESYACVQLEDLFIYLFIYLRII
jgi:hypothetical protein